MQISLSDEPMCLCGGGGGRTLKSKYLSCEQLGIARVINTIFWVNELIYRSTNVFLGSVCLPAKFFS